MHPPLRRLLGLVLGALALVALAACDGEAQEAEGTADPADPGVVAERPEVGEPVAGCVEIPERDGAYEIPDAGTVVLGEDLAVEDVQTTTDRWTARVDQEGGGEAAVTFIGEDRVVAFTASGEAGDVTAQACDET
jgi:hypothetical protein